MGGSTLISMLLFYVVPIVFAVWFAMALIKTQKERNEILQSISNKLDRIDKQGNNQM